MKAHFLIAAALACAGCASTAPAEQASVVRAGDQSMTCTQIADEAATLSERMGGTPTGGALGTAATVAKAGAAALIPGAGLVMAGVNVLNAPERQRREADENRWHYLNGLYTARNCLQGGR